MGAVCGKAARTDLSGARGNSRPYRNRGLTVIPGRAASTTASENIETRHQRRFVGMNSRPWFETRSFAALLNMRAAHAALVYQRHIRADLILRSAPYRRFFRH